MMDTRFAVQNAIFPLVFSIIAREALDEDDKIFKMMQDDLQEWVDALKPHQHNAFRKNTTELAGALLDLTHDKKACEGRGGTSTTKIVGSLCLMMQNLPVEATDRFSDALAELTENVYEELGSDWDGQFDSGSLEKTAKKGISLLKERGYFL